MSMSPADQAKYKALYLETSRQYLQKIEHLLSQFLTGQQNEEQLKELVIAAHSLSGQSRVIGYNQIGEYASLIQKVMEEKTVLDQMLLQTIQTGIKKMYVSLDEIEKNDTELDLSEEIKELQKKTGV